MSFARLIFALALVCAAGSRFSWAAVADEAETFDSRLVRGSFVSEVSGVRAAGMGGAYTAVGDDVSAIASNPGGLGQVGTMQAEVVHDVMARTDPADGSYGATDLSLTYLAGAMPLGRSAVMGISLASFGYGEYEVRDSFGALLGTDSARDLALKVSLAALNPGASDGMSWSGLSIEYVKDAAGGKLFGLGAGGVMRLGPNVKGGWALQHIGPEKDGFSLPADIKLGVAFAEPYAPVPLLLAVDVGYAFTAGGVWVSAGSEAQVFPVLCVRAGYRLRGDDHGLGGLTGASAGFGVKLGGVCINYAFRPFGDLVSSHRMGITFAQDKERKKAEAAKIEEIRVKEEKAKEAEDAAKARKLLPPPPEFLTPPLEDDDEDRLPSPRVPNGR